MSGRALAGLLALAGMWGSSFLFVRVGLQVFEPPQVVLGRLTVGALLLAGVVAVGRFRLPRSPVVWGHLALMGLVANVVPWLLFAWGQQFIASGLAGILNAATPLFTALFVSLALAEERLPWHRVAGIVVGFLGVVIIVDPFDVGGTTPLTASVPGQLACLGAAACYGAGFTYTRRFLANHGHSPLVLAAGQLACGAGTLWLAAPFLAAQPISPRLAPVAGVAALGLFGTGLAYLLYYRLLGELGATRTSTVTYLIPVVAVTLGVVVLGEPLTPAMVAGAVVVVLGVAMVQRRVGTPPAATGPADSGTVTTPPTTGGRAGRGRSRRPGARPDRGDPLA